MKVPKSLLCTGIALALASAASAQVVDVANERPIKRIKSFTQCTYDMATGRITKNAVPKKSASLPTPGCYSNTDASGIFTSPMEQNTETLVDWGIMGGTQSTKCTGLSAIVGGFDFAYATSSADTSIAGPGAALTLKFYTGYCGFGADSGNCPVASFAFSGLPGFSGASTGIGAAYGFTVTINPGFEFCMPTGKVGFGISSPEASSAGNGFANTGPRLVFGGDGTSAAAGVVGGPNSCDGTLDAIDSWMPDTKGVTGGTFYFGGAPNNFSSFYLEVLRASLATTASASMFNAAPNKAGSMVCGNPVLGGTLTATLLCPGHLAAFAFAFDTPFPAGVALGGGQRLLCLDFGSGELLSGSGFATSATGPVGACTSFALTYPMPKRLDLCGFTMCMQGLCAFGVVPFALTGACTLVFGG